MASAVVTVRSKGLPSTHCLSCMLYGNIAGGQSWLGVPRGLTLDYNDGVPGLWDVLLTIRRPKWLKPKFYSQFTANLIMLLWSK